MRGPRDPRVRVALALALCLVGLALVLAAVNRLTPEPKGPPSSSYATTPSGLAAYAAVLERSGHAAQTIVIKFLERAGRKHPIRFFQITFH